MVPKRCIVRALAARRPRRLNNINEIEIGKRRYTQIQMCHHHPSPSHHPALPLLFNAASNTNYLSRHSFHRQLSTSPSTSSSTIKPAVSEAQRRSAQLELERMTHSTNRLVNIMDTTTTNNNGKEEIISEAIVNEARVAIHYWSRRWYMHFHPGFGRAAKGSALSMDALRKKWDTTTISNNQATVAMNDNGSVDGGALSKDSIPEEATSTTNNNNAASIQNLSGDYGAKQAEKLLDWSISNKLISRGLFDTSADMATQQMDKVWGKSGIISPNLMCVNIIETYLLPTAYGGVGGGGGQIENGMDQSSSTTSAGMSNIATLTKHFTINASYVQSVVDATRVLKKMKQLQGDFPEVLASDALSVKAELNVWAKRAIILGKNQTISASGGAGSVLAGVATNDPKEMLRQLEQQDGTTTQGGGGDAFFGEEAYTLQGCLDQMELIISQAEEKYITTKDESICPSTDWYNHILGALARSDVGGAVTKAKQILHGMEAYDGFLSERYQNSSNLRQCWASPDTVSYNSLLFCLARDARKSSAIEAEQLLNNMKEQYERTKASNIEPDEVTYGAVLHALAQAGMAYEAERILDSLEEEDEPTITPSLTIYNTVLNAWANSFLHQIAPKRAQALLERMKALSSTGKNPHVEPDAISISTVISCHARSKTRQGAERGEQILNEAIDMYSKGNSRVKPDSIMFNCAIQGWTSISGIESDNEGGLSYKELPAERAEKLLKRMKDAHLDVHPVAQTFNIILDCWAKSETKDATERALSLMKEMATYNIAPDECSYNSVLHAMTKEKDPKWVAKAEDMFEEMKGKISTSQITYHVMMNIYAKSADRDGARKAEELLFRIEEENFSPSYISYNICIDAYARRGNHRKAQSLLDEMISLADQGKTDCRPSIHSFAAVVNALAKSGDIDAVARAEDIIQKVEELEYVSSNSILYNSLIDCIVKSKGPDSALKAEKILIKLEEMHRNGNKNVRPTPFAYSMVLTCCARSKDPSAAERSEGILLNMEKLHDEGVADAVANSRCYSAAISAWAHSSSPHAVDRALALVDRTEENGKNGSVHSKPNAHCYNGCIHAIAKSQLRGKARLCKDILQRMAAAKENGYHEAAPSLVTYSTIINACAFTRGTEEDQKEAFDLARSCFQTLMESKDMEPDVSTFTNFFLVVSRHLRHGAIRDQFAEAVFLEATTRGKVNNQVTKSFQKASPSVSKRMLAEHKVLPSEWSSNVKQRGYRT